MKWFNKLALLFVRAEYSSDTSAEGTTVLTYKQFRGITYVVGIREIKFAVPENVELTYGDT